MGVGWSSPVRCIGSGLCGLDVGTLSFSHLFIHLRSLGLGRCSFSVQLDIQSTPANAVVAAYNCIQEEACKTRTCDAERYRDSKYLLRIAILL